MKNLNIKTVVIAVVVVGVIYYLFFYTPKAVTDDAPQATPPSPTPSNAAITTPTPAPATSASTSLNSTQIMKRGDKGETVRYIQMALNRVLSAKGKTTLAVDEDFGGLTEGAMVYVMNKKTGSYSQVKTAVIARFSAMGKPNPYTSSSTSGSNSSTQPSATNIAALGFTTLNPLVSGYLSYLGFI